MKKRILNIVIIICLGLLTSCKSDNAEGILIEKLLVENQSFSENKQMIELIKLTLLEDETSFEALLFIPNVDDGEPAYIHGYTIHQIINKLGEEKIIDMLNHFELKSLKTLNTYIRSGFDYTSAYKDNFSDEFPKLYKYINEKIKK
ncbi:hypothetical protein [Winogradskyella poriferorum]|uniref:hypothetical protein n=1 Tax=Winogradskyella poriferorum TaxID=307627 RepID=UPI003D65F06F